jgi:hypothetical protein
MKFGRLAYLLLAPLAATAEDYDCDGEGCSMDPEEMGPRVCGVDDITYGNECVAVCQVGLCKY